MSVVAVVAIFVFAVAVVADDGKGLGDSSLEVADALNGHGSGTGIHIFSIKNILIGPSLPAFISPNVLNFLVENYNIAPISTPEED